MSGRNRGPPPPHLPARNPAGFRQSHDPPYGRSLGSTQPLDDERDLRGPGHAPMFQHPAAAAAIIQDRLAAQQHEIQGMLADNQRLAATHVALRQELELAQHEIRRMRNALGSARAEADLQLREGYEKAMKMEAELRSVEAVKAELERVRKDIQQMGAARQELGGQVQSLNKELDRTNVELQRVPPLKGEIENTRQELQRARDAIEYEKKGYAENYEHGQAMEKNLITMARELEKLRAELASSQKRAGPPAVVGNPGATYSGNYGNAEVVYGVNPYPAGYGMNPAQGASEGGVPHYGHGPPASWPTYDMQWPHGRR